MIITYTSSNASITVLYSTTAQIWPRKRFFSFFVAFLESEPA
jgi:hypothetical protein